MARCREYGSTSGCGRCRVNLQSSGDLKALSFSNIVSICYTLCQNASEEMARVNLQSLDIRCDCVVSIRRQPRGRKVRLTDILLLWKRGHSGRDSDHSSRSVNELVGWLLSADDRESMLAQTLSIQQLLTPPQMPLSCVGKGA